MVNVVQIIGGRENVGNPSDGNDFFMKWINMLISPSTCPKLKIKSTITDNVQ
jgi:hypothetical protein